MDSLLSLLFEQAPILTTLTGCLALIVIPGSIALLLAWGISRYNSAVKALAASQHWPYLMAAYERRSQPEKAGQNLVQSVQP